MEKSVFERKRERGKGWKGIMFEAIIGDYAYLLAHYGSLKGPDRDYYVRRTSSSGSPKTTPAVRPGEI